jgi:hypothetical protein
MATVTQPGAGICSGDNLFQRAARQHQTLHLCQTSQLTAFKGLQPLHLPV